MAASGIVGDNIERALVTIHEINPELSLHRINGQWIFPVYAASGGLSTKRVVYLVRPSYYRTKDGISVMPCLAVEYDDNAATLVKAAAKFDQLAKLVNFDGGDMGYPVKI